MYKKIVLYISVLFCLSLQAFAQNPGIDSLKNVITHSENDSTKVYTLLALSKEFFSINLGQSIIYATEALDLSVKLKFNPGLALAYKNIGIAKYMEGKYLASVENYEQSLVLFDTLKDNNGIANILSNEGAVYFNQADYEKALDLSLIHI